MAILILLSLLRPYSLLALKDFHIIWLSNPSTLSIPDEGDSSKTSCKLNLILQQVLQTYLDLILQQVLQTYLDLKLQQVLQTYLDLKSKSSLVKRHCPV
jgi:hypothetical protein